MSWGSKDKGALVSSRPTLHASARLGPEPTESMAQVAEAVQLIPRHVLLEAAPLPSKARAMLATTPQYRFSANIILLDKLRPLVRL